MKNMHTDQNIVNCPWCGTITKRLHRHLKEHQCNIPEHERKVKQKAVCEYCKKEYSSVKIMREHVKNMHSEVKEYICVRYQLNLLKHALKPISMAEKVSIRIDARKLLSIQYMIRHWYKKQDLN